MNTTTLATEDRSQWQVLIVEVAHAATGCRPGRRIAEPQDPANQWP